MRSGTTTLPGARERRRLGPADAWCALLATPAEEAAAAMPGHASIAHGGALPAVALACTRSRAGNGRRKTQPPSSAHSAASRRLVSPQTGNRPGSAGRERRPPTVPTRRVAQPAAARRDHKERSPRPADRAWSTAPASSACATPCCRCGRGTTKHSTDQTVPSYGSGRSAGERSEPGPEQRARRRRPPSRPACPRSRPAGRAASARPRARAGVPGCRPGPGSRPSAGAGRHTSTGTGRPWCRTPPARRPTGPPWPARS